MWPMMTELIESYAYGLNLDEFWSVYSDVLTFATKYIRQRPMELNKNALELIKRYEQNNQIYPEYFSFRSQLFKLLSSFPDIADKRTRILSPIFIELYK